jgi:hypothetical protein
MSVNSQYQRGYDVQYVDLAKHYCKSGHGEPSVYKAQPVAAFFLCC